MTSGENLVGQSVSSHNLSTSVSFLNTYIGVFCIHLREKKIIPWWLESFLMVFATRFYDIIVTLCSFLATSNDELLQPLSLIQADDD